MKTVKHLLLFCLLIFGSQYIYAQSNYKQGYVITNEGDTVIGWIDYRTDRMNSQACRFKKDIMNKTAETYVPGQIAGYRFLEEGKFYVTRTIEINGLPQTVFLEYLLQGIMNLYFLSDETTNLNYYIFEDKKDGKMTYVTKHPNQMIQGDDGSYYNKKDMRYRNELAYTFRDYDLIKKETGKLNFVHNSMIGLAKDYHNQVCTTGEECIEFETKLDKNYVEVHYSISGGIERQLFKYERLDLNFNPHFAPFIKAGVDFSVPRWMKSLSLSFNVYLTDIDQSYKGNIEGPWMWNYWDYSFKAYQVGVDMAAKYTYPKGKIRPSCHIGLDLYNTTFGKKIYSYAEFINPEDNTVSSETIVNEGFSKNVSSHDYYVFETVNAGAGINFLVRKKQFLFLNVNYKMSMRNWQLEVGYRF
jgi:hypothetical protein